ncbi:TAXI family TRAP transporter solute-binding subunit [Roseivivax isoporae]|uniref:C4-dicarboxylate ABC transporter substrate-binding protein n=1 Tax=Roseivivax isoporae LMG 25204 TaxID=1449351 RepID=X7FBC2_9RHOB|nr:TAXI family TRAP transporter solute-binding subunit [Roseivivax isoporae]ETX29416.1 C4-dicarboxylate ABC transporter substrate-binding protein [Roseivivax isoporae LMG 25204]
MTHQRTRMLGLVAGAGLLAGGPAAAQEFITIGTAGQTGLYYVVGQSICRLVNRRADDNGLSCTASATGGSIANLNGIASGDLDFGIVQSDWQYHAVNGTSTFADAGPNENLRAIFSAHADVVTVVARADSGIETLQDLPGHRVNIGNPGSGSRATAEVLLETVGIDVGSFSLASELQSSEQSAALCDNRIDAMMFSAGHPVGNIKEATVSCDTRFLQIDAPEVEAMIAETPYYSAATIPAGLYEGQEDEIRSYGPLATFVTSTDTSDEAVYAVVKAVFDNFDRFRDLHPAFANLEKQDMITRGIIAPLHPGAERYYREQGWM